MTTLWPAWSMVAVLVLTGAVTIVLTLADRRVRSSPQQTETERRRRLARGLRISAAVSVASGLATTMLATVSYQVVPVWYFLLWTTVPALTLAGITALVATLVQRGHTSAARWQIWLHLPTTTTVLAIAGLLTVHAYLYTNIVPGWYLHHARLPQGIDQLGAIATGIAILPLIFRRLDHQVLASPVVIGTIVWTHSYTNTALVIGLLLTAVILWWTTRLRPAAAYNDPHYRATHMASELEPTLAAPTGL
jgi:hypothetical protein